MTAAAELMAVAPAASSVDPSFLSLLDEMSQMAWLKDASGYTFWYNRRWYEYTGTLYEDVKGSGWTSLHHPDHVDRVRESLQACLATGKPWDETFPLRGVDGNYRWFLTRAIPVRDGSGSILRWVGTNTDVTEQMAAEATLREASARKDKLVSLLAHELRNPIAPIMAASQVLLTGRATGPQRDAAAEMIARQARHMARLIEDLLDTARIDQGTVPLRLAALDLAKVVADTSEDYRASIEEDGVWLKVVIGAQPLTVNGDATRLAQVISNLLHNACKFTPRGGTITVSLAAADDGSSVAILRIDDTGAGIAADLLPEVFEAFVQSNTASSKGRGGLGLGLRLVKGLVGLHGGSVEAHSEGTGHGSSFTVRLPTIDPVALRDAGRAPLAR